MNAFHLRIPGMSGCGSVGSGSKGGIVPGCTTVVGAVATIASGDSPTSSGAPTSTAQEVSASTITLPKSRFIAARPRRERRRVKAAARPG